MRKKNLPSAEAVEKFEFCIVFVVVPLVIYMVSVIYKTVTYDGSPLIGFFKALFQFVNWLQ